MSSVDRVSYRKHIIAAIDLVKSKRARPDVSRIMEQVMKTLGTGMSETAFKKKFTTELESAVHDGIVIKVKYKDGISYRNPLATSVVIGKNVGEESYNPTEQDQQEQQGNGKRTAAIMDGSTDGTKGKNDHKDVHEGDSHVMDGLTDHGSDDNNDVNSGPCGNGG